MKNTNSRILKAHEAAPHVSKMFRQLPATNMQPVDCALWLAIELLKTVKVPEEYQLDEQSMTVPDYGIPYALYIGQGDYKEHEKAAASLLRMCLHVKERGYSFDYERQDIPLKLAELSGFVPDFQKRNSEKPRPNRSKPDALDQGIDKALRNNPESSWKEIIQYLQSANEAVITSWELETVTYTDDAGIPKQISEKTFKNRITKARRRLKSPKRSR